MITRLLLPLLGLATLAPGVMSQTTVTRDYTYAATHLGVTRVVETTSDGTTRTTNTVYAHEQAGMTAMANRNMRAQTYSVTVLNGSDVEAKSWTVWQPSFTPPAPPAAQPAWRPAETWVWKGTGDGTSNDASAPATPTESGAAAEVIRTAQATAFDAYGRPTSIADARSNVTAIAYGPSNVGQLPTSITRPPLNGVTHATTIAYDAGGRPTSITDPNSAATTFRYDGLGRLTGVRRPGTPGTCSATSTSCTSTYAYGNYASATQPASVTLRDYANATTYAETVTYSDGFGRTLQTQIKDAAGYRVQATTYDGAGRPARSYAAYARAGTTPTYDAAFDANAAAHYDGTPGPNAAGRPYVQVTSVSDPTGRTATVAGEGTATTSKVTYGLEPLGGKTYTFTETADETNRKVRAYTDALGRAVATTAGYGSIQSFAASETATTLMAYDVVNRLTRTTSPVGLQTNHTYDGAGRLVRTVSPDAGTLLLKYDPAGTPATDATLSRPAPPTWPSTPSTTPTTGLPRRAGGRPPAPRPGPASTAPSL